MEVNERVDFWLRSGWNSTATVLTILATLGGMWLGSEYRETPPDEKERVEAFFGDLKKPFEYDISADKGRVSPFRIIGFTLAILGCVMAGIAVIVLVFYHDSRAFYLNLLVGVIMICLGAIMRLMGGKTEPEPDLME